VLYFDLQVAATEEKTALEEAQRAAAKERKMKCLEWIPKYFEQVVYTYLYILRRISKQICEDGKNQK
jgi:hypothetical protein